MRDEGSMQREDEIQGSLHFAMDDKAVHCFGRDDVASEGEW